MEILPGDHRINFEFELGPDSAVWSVSLPRMSDKQRVDPLWGTPWNPRF